MEALLPPAPSRLLPPSPPSSRVVGKIPSYGCTWMFFSQLKRLHRAATDRDPDHWENWAMSTAASAAAVCLLIPVDTVKTRMVTQLTTQTLTPYVNMLDCFLRVSKEEGFGALYRALPPRLLSVVPMIGIQFTAYEGIKAALVRRNAARLAVAVAA